MSIALMTAAFKADIPATQKLVLLALCDSANDQGECYPSVKALEGKCSLKARAIQYCLDAIEAAGMLKREFRNGRSTIYWITDPRTWCTPASDAPPHVVHHTPAFDAPLPPHVVHPGGAYGAPITIREPKKEKEKGEKRAPIGTRIPSDWQPDLLYAKEKGVVNAAGEAEAFRDHWLADTTPKALKADWTAAWRTWCRNSIKYAKPANETVYQRSMRERAAEIHPGIARKAPGQINPNPMEVLDGFIKPRLLG